MGQTAAAVIGAAIAALHSCSDSVVLLTDELGNLLVDPEGALISEG